MQRRQLQSDKIRCRIPERFIIYVVGSLLAVDKLIKPPDGARTRWRDRGFSGLALDLWGLCTVRTDGRVAGDGNQDRSDNAGNVAPLLLLLAPEEGPRSAKGGRIVAGLFGQQDVR
jgi:hypothetical protein